MASELARLRIYQIIKQRASQICRTGAIWSEVTAPLSARRATPPPSSAAEIRIYEPCPDNAVSPDDKGSWYRKHPGIIALIIGKRSTVGGQQWLKIGSDPDGKVKRQGVAVIHID